MYEGTHFFKQCDSSPIQPFPVQISQYSLDFHGTFWGPAPLFFQVSQYSRDLLHPQLLHLPVTKEDWTWLNEVKCQLVLLPCYALPNIIHMQQQPRRSSLWPDVIRITNFSMLASVITSLYVVLYDWLMCLRFSWGEFFLVMRLLFILYSFYASMIFGSFIFEMTTAFHWIIDSFRLEKTSKITFCKGEDDMLIWFWPKSFSSRYKAFI